MNSLVNFIKIFPLFIASVSAHELFKDVNTEQGVVRGQKHTINDYFQFLGIPYAAAPTGLNRFKAPSPPANRSKIFIANRSVTCSQLLVVNEDCLVVNIYTPLNINKTLPVLFYIHGGAFLIGSGILNDQVKHLMKTDIIIVTVNYRLGHLGFLCLGIKEAPGNAALKDVIAGLRWVRTNIDNFGGDRDDVTIAGTSAGAAMVEILVLSPLTKGLFVKAIVESGSSLAPWSLDIEPIKTAKNTAATLFYRGNFCLEDLATFYRNANIKILNAYLVYNFYSRTNGTTGFVPCIEKPGSDAVLYEDPLDIIRKGNFNQVPILYIFANGEGFFRVGEFYSYKGKMNENFSNFMPANLDFKNDSIKYEESNTTKTFYFGNQSVSEDTIVPFINYFGDTLFIYPVINSSRNIASTSCDDVYLLKFTYEGGLNNNKLLFSQVPGAVHGDAFNYVFAQDDVTDNMDQEKVDLMVGIYSNFVKYGTPQYPHWGPLTPSALNYLEVGNETKILENPYPNRTTFWDRMYSKYRLKLAPVDGGTSC